MTYEPASRQVLRCLSGSLDSASYSVYGALYSETVDHVVVRPVAIRIGLSVGGAGRSMLVSRHPRAMKHSDHVPVRNGGNPDAAKPA